MTLELDDLDLWPPPEPVEPVPTPKRHRHVWELGSRRLNPTALQQAWVRGLLMSVEGYQAEVAYVCFRHAEPVVRDETKARQGRNNRKRGNAIQRQRITGLGGRNLAGNNPNLDGLGEKFRYESKSGGSFPERLYRWLKGIPIQAGQMAVLIVTDAPGPGHRARSVVVVDYDEWRALHGETP